MRDMASEAVNMTPTRHNFEHVTIIICPMNPEHLDSAREEWVHFDSVEDVERPVPVVRVLAEVKVDGAEDTTKGDVAME